MSPPDPFDFDDLIAYLQAWFSWKKADNPRYGHRRFAMDCGQSNPGALANVFNGNRFPTDALLTSFLPALKLHEHPEAQAVEGADDAMVELLFLLRDLGEARRELALKRAELEEVDARTEGRQDLVSRRQRQSRGRMLLRARQEVEACELQLKAARALRSFEPLEREGYRVLSSWYYPVIVELTRCVGFTWDGAWISEALGGVISSAEADEALLALESIGALRRTGAGVERAAPTAVTPKTVQSMAVSQYYGGIYAQCGRSLRRLLKPEERAYNAACRLGGVTVAVPGEAVARVHALMQTFQTQLLAELESFDAQPDAVYQVYLHAFPFTEPLGAA